MNKIIFFALVFATSAASTAISYSGLKNSRWGFFAYLVMGLLCAGAWLLTVKGIKNPNEILITGLTSDVIGKAAGIGLPFLVFGARAEPKAIAGLAIMAVGMFVSSR